MNKYLDEMKDKITGLNKKIKRLENKKFELLESYKEDHEQEVN